MHKTSEQTLIKPSLTKLKWLLMNQQFFFGTEGVNKFIFNMYYPNFMRLTNEVIQKKDKMTDKKV